MFPFRGLFDKEDGKGDQRMLKYEGHQLYHIYSSLWRQLSWKNYLFVIFKILRMFVNIMTADDKCFLLNRDNLRQPVYIQVSGKEKTISQSFSLLLKSRLNIFQKKMTFIADVFPKLRTRKKWLNKSLRSVVSKDPLTSHIVRETKHCWNLSHTSFTNFIDFS